MQNRSAPEQAETLNSEYASVAKKRPQERDADAVSALDLAQAARRALWGPAAATPRAAS